MKSSIRGKTYAHLDGLTSERIDRPSRPDLELVVDHMSQPLVINQAKIDISLKLLAGDPRIHRLVPVVVVSRG